MNKFRIALGCLLAAALFAGCQSPAPTEPTPETGTAPAEPRPDSILYYGEILEIRSADSGTLLSMNSEKSGPWILRLSEDTVFVDSGRRTLFDPDTLAVGDRVYVFHSPVAAYSMPPQSQAFAVLRNIPMDASCGMYHEVESLEQKDGTLLITTDNGALTLGADADTRIFDTQDREVTQLTPGSHVIAWYWDQGQQILHPSHILVLP